MSAIIKFFVAPDNAAAAGVALGGPDASVKSVTYGNFDVLSSLDEWESLLTNRDLEELAAGGGPDLVSGAGTPPVLLVPADLTEALAHVDNETLRITADRWIGLRADEHEEIDDELARELLGEVAALSAEAERTKGALYCWIC